jgi:hypothetical protein
MRMRHESHKQLSRLRDLQRDAVHMLKEKRDGISREKDVYRRTIALLLWSGTAQCLIREFERISKTRVEGCEWDSLRELDAEVCNVRREAMDLLSAGKK